ncbi:single-stranded DNA-binding protein [Phormidium sp. LEGE 05292]|uniref:single-stranded DNA-binding protein n=1 Tax=[Phormidium] sp. LEGE 05292 TaxID=767427 RepID=UPI00187F81CF|nr:single-stranded DNA-binding protein [Phormidium sp. LEGE 05292]MBE9226629.1 single-stranded DNA-binding protein [Phormidium sp. LEGE 05292]
MNSCILMAEVVQDPQLRYTPDNLAVAEMLVQFPGIKPDDPPANLKVIGWGNLATEIHERCHRGLHIVIEGRLGMNTFERKPEGFKEKRAELTAQKVHYLGASDSFAAATTGTTSARSQATNSNQDSYHSDNVATTSGRSFATASATNTATIPEVDDEPLPSVTTTTKPKPTTPVNPPDVDDIPF